MSGIELTSNQILSSLSTNVLQSKQPPASSNTTSPQTAHSGVISAHHASHSQAALSLNSLHNFNTSEVKARAKSIQINNSQVSTNTDLASSRSNFHYL